MTTNDVSHYYDELHRWTLQDKEFQVFSGLENDTIHRFLVDPATGQFSPDTVYSFIDPYLPPRGSACGLDAGCGYGGTCFRAATVHGGHWTGITVSPEQWRHANGIARARGMEHSVDFLLRSYDDPLPDRFNVVVAIESLIHSADPDRTMANLAASLDDGGRLMIVDDMPIDRVAASDAACLADFKRAWRCPRAPSAVIWKNTAAAHALHLVAERDLSELMRPRAEADLDAALDDLEAQRAAKSDRGFARLSDAEIGGLHLERLHARGAVRYMMLVFEKAR